MEIDFRGLPLLMSQHLLDCRRRNFAGRVRCNGRPPPSLTAYALHRPDELWAVLLVNKDPVQAWTVTPRFVGPEPSAVTFFEGTCDIYQFSRAQYRWQADGAKGRPALSHPPKHNTWLAGNSTSFHLPPWSLTVIRGRKPLSGEQNWE